MNAKNYSYISFLTFLWCFTISYSNAQCAKEVEDQLKKTIGSDVYSLYGFINAAKVAAFAEDEPIKIGLKAQAVARWNSLLACTHKYILDQLKLKNVPKEYVSSVKTLETINKELQKIIQNLHATYIYNNQYKTLSIADKKNLDTSKKKINTYLEKLYELFINSLETIVNDVPYSNQWKKQVANSSLESLFSEYQTFFQTYEQAKKQLGKMTPEQIDYFLRIAKVIKIGESRNVKYIKEKETLAALAFFDKLEKFSYKLSQEIEEQKPKASKEWFTGPEKTKLKKLIKIFDASQEIMHALLILYPLSPSYSEKLRKTKIKDVPSLIIFSESGGLSEVLQSIKRNIDTLLKK